MVAVEIDPVLAGGLPATVAAARAGVRRPARRSCTPTRCGCDALPGPPPTALVANLPYNVAVPVLLHLLEPLPVDATGAGDGAGRGRRPAGRAARRPRSTACRR